MNKPDWKDAPEWANWLAQDFDGLWFWFENKPNLITKVWDSDMGRISSSKCQGYENSLEERPS